MKTVLFIFTLLLCPTLSFGESQPAIFNDNHTSINLGQTSKIYQDPQSINSFDDVVQLSDQNIFTPLNKPFIQLGETLGNNWIKTELSIQKSTNQTLYLYIKAPQVHEIDVYFPQTNRNKIAYSLGLNKPNSSDQIHHPDYIIPIPETPHTTITIFIRLSTPTPLNVQIFAVDNIEIVKTSIKDFLFSGFFSGVIFIFLIGNILLFTYTKHNMYIIHSAFLVCILAIHLSLHGFISYFFSLLPYTRDMLLSLFIFFYLSSLAFFSRHYLDTQIHFPKIDKLLLVIGTLNITFSLVMSVSSNDLNNSVILTNLLATNTLLLIFSLYVFIKKTPYSGYYLLARSISFLGFYIWVLSVYGVYPNPTYYQWGLTTIMLLEASIHFSGMIKRLTHFNFSSKSKKSFDTAPLNAKPSLIDAGKRMRRQINILDHYITSCRSALLSDQDKELNLEASLASNNLKFLAENLSLLSNQKNNQEHPILLDKVFQIALENFSNIDQDNSDLLLTTENTKNIELLNNIHILQQIIVNLAQECKHLNDQQLSIHITHIEHTKLGIKTLDICCSPVSNRAKNELHSFNLGAGLIKETVEHLEGSISMSNNVLSINIPIQSRLQSLPYDTLEADPAQIFVIGNESLLVQRTLRSLQTWPNNVLQIKNINELLTEVKTLHNENTINLVLMFENEGYIPNLALRQIREKLHAGDQCILVTENDKMSRNYALTLGFDDLFSNTDVEQQLRESLERFTLKGLRIKNASLQTGKK